MVHIKGLPEVMDLKDENDVVVGRYGITPETHMDYLILAHDHESRSYSADEVSLLEKVIMDPTTDMVQRKRSIGILAHLGTPAAYRILEQYMAQCPVEMKAWAELALMECRIFLEGELGKDNLVFMSGGLGGDGSRMRYWILFLPAAGKQFAEKERLLVEEEARFVAMRRECGLEEVKLFFKGIAITVLVPLRLAVGDFLEDVRAQSRILGCPIAEDCMVTNSHIPSEEEYLGLIRELDNPKS